MRVLAGALMVLSILSISAVAQDDKKKPDDVLQKKDGGIVVGRIQKLDADNVEILVNGEKDARKISLRELNPYSVYKIRLDRIDKSSGDAHLALAEFCMANGLYAPATREFEEAARLDKSLEEKAKKRREEAHNEDGRARFEEAKRQAAEHKYDDANRTCQVLVEKYSDTPYFEEAKKLVAKIAEEIAKENEAKKKQIEDKKEAQEKKKAAIAENQEKDVLTKTAEMIDDAGKLWLEGLDGEAKNLTRGEKAWRGAEIAILSARRNIEFLLKSNDLETLKKAKEMERACDSILVKVYYRLGRMWAVELNYPVALEWLNKAMKVPHDEQMDRQINEVLLTISQLKMRERAAGKGY
jgi:tetratricopeptide (TPR) repeat protein